MPPSTTGAKRLVFQLCYCFWLSPDHPPFQTQLFPPHAQGGSGGWLQEQREPTLTPSHSHNPPKAAEIPPALRPSSPLAPTELQQSKPLSHRRSVTKSSQASREPPSSPSCPPALPSSPLAPEPTGSTACCAAPSPPLPN